MLLVCNAISPDSPPPCLSLSRSLYHVSLLSQTNESLIFFIPGPWETIDYERRICMQIRWKPRERERESLKTSIARLVRLFFHILLEMTINISMIFRRIIGYSFLRSFKDWSPVEKRTIRRSFLRYFIRRRRYPQAALLRPTCTVINLKRTGNEGGVKSKFQREFERRWRSYECLQDDTTVRLTLRQP